MRELRLWAAAAAGPACAAGFYALATMRRRRSLHPAGIGYGCPMKAGFGPECPCSRPARRIRPGFASLGVAAIVPPPAP
jgi:hypothetical protein